MNTDLKTYRRYAKSRAPKSPFGRDMSIAFFSGGAVCLFAEGVRNMLLYYMPQLAKETVGMFVSMLLIAIAVVLTACGHFDDIARHCGASTLVPITGFANAVASSAIDAKSEGFILGVGSKIFQIAGPVILYGVSASVVYGVIYYIVSLF